MVINDTVVIMVMSGVEDGLTYPFQAQNDGTVRGDHWVLSIGRKDDNDLCLKKDTFVSRNHARLFWRNQQWWLEDRNSTNGTFIENSENIFEDSRVNGIIPLTEGQLFRVGRTWLRIQAE